MFLVSSKQNVEIDIQSIEVEQSEQAINLLITKGTLCNLLDSQMNEISYLPEYKTQCNVV